MAKNARSADSSVSEVVRPNSSSGDHKLEFHRVFDAPRELVFSAWTEPEHLRHWWDPTGAPLQTCEIDLRPGGAFRWVNRNGHEFAGTYRQVIRPELIVIGVRTWPDRPELVGTQAFTQVGEKTELSMTIECASQRDLDALREMRVDVGTSQTLENLSRYLPQMSRT